MITPNAAYKTLAAQTLGACYVASENLIISPVLGDFATVVGRSAQMLHGDPNDTNVAGVRVGSATGPLVSHSILTAPGSFIEGPTNTQEIHTAMKHLLLSSTGGITVTAGYDAAAVALGLPLSPGEVEGTSGSPGSFPPGESFFDMFVEVVIPQLGLSNNHFVNTSPLLVVNSNVTTLPPRAIYIHGESNAVPVFFKGSNQIFGYLRLAGHGMNFACLDPNGPPPDCSGMNSHNCPDGVTLYQTLNTLRHAPGGLMPCPQCDVVGPTIPTLGTAGMITLLLVLLAAGTFIIMRRGRGATST